MTPTPPASRRNPVVVAIDVVAGILSLTLGTALAVAGMTVP